MKINEVVVEGLYDTLAGAGQFVKQAKNKPGKETQAFDTAMANAPAPVGYKIELAPGSFVVKTNDGWYRSADKYFIPTNTPAHQQYENIAKKGIHSFVNKSAVEPSEFIKQFKIVDDNPVTIQWKNQAFQRKDGTGTWVNFPGGKPVSQQMVAALDKVSPLPTNNEPAKPPIGGTKAISVTDNAGVVWTKDEDNNRWLNDAGTVANPASAERLEKRAITQYQARQMSA